MDIRFAASQSVEIVVQEQPIPIAHYLRQPQRVVTALAASSRIELLNDDQFRLTMRPLNFLSLSIQPTVDMRVWADSNGAINVKSIACEIRGVEYINQRFSLNLVGQLYPTQIEQTTYLKGRADLEVQVELPPPFLLTPKFLLERAGNGLLLSVLSTIKQRLLHQLLLDYRNWATSQSETEVSQGRNLFPVNHPAS
ncbi:DUF1997 domain-containing protein [Phormidesmis priestleyi ULC007]|uniref:DUF1997 domain-containing protein n=1 Tax=Phormidesmis priestleyi ULC007 TaxID=1920490 RepID=A0A2T1DNY3_9CYAN|nr:DUF1997 domain-containing protein [Phormidesmis priestleyi]PSB22210.1 DUF1997 domain-containing protein [Phormidesmis priestleyi ULC007]PZO52529.1 MAG: DUF1997 domain-containing protein [Phormidesmis priestleyi]